jgi:putative transposase
MMKKPKSLYHGHRFPAGVISCAVRWYFRFQLSLRDIEELLFERGVTVTYVPKEVYIGGRDDQVLV